LGGRGQFSHAFSGEVYDFYTASPEYFGYTLVRKTAQARTHTSVGSSLNGYTGSLQQLPHSLPLRSEALTTFQKQKLA
jgi:hypothetical protein